MNTKRVPVAIDPSGDNRPTRRQFLNHCGAAVASTWAAQDGAAAADPPTDRVRFGQTRLWVSRYCQGTAFRQVPRDDNPAARAILHRCLDVGINFFDTAEAYGWGGSELVLGRAIKSRRDDVVICTKATPHSAPVRDPDPNKFRAGAPLTFSRDILFRKLDGSLKRLGTDYVDLFLFHSWDNATPLEMLAQWMDELVTSGKIRYWGTSNFTAQQVAGFRDIAEGDARRSRIAGTEDYYHICAGERYDPELFKAIGNGNHHLGLLAFSPQEEGKLSPGREAELGKARVPVVRELDRVAKSLGATRPQVCIAWSLARPEVTSVLGGAESPEHVQENYGGTQLELPPDALAALNAASDVYRQHRWQRVRQSQSRETTP